VVRPPYESGIKIVPFIVTGYMPMILIRQTVGYTVGAVKNNAALLFHRTITPLHLMLARIVVEIIGVTLALVTIIAFYNMIGLMGLPANITDLGYVYLGWFLLAWLTAGLALFMAALAELFEFIERIVQLITYLLVPLSGAFFMASSMPPM
jgi:capsular polysaccharide transport system permease protein